MAGAVRQAEVGGFGFLLIFLVHYLACFWAFVGVNWTPAATDEMRWVEFYGYESHSKPRLYGISAYVAVSAIFGGVSSISPQNGGEYLVISIMMLVGGLVWSYILGSLCAIFASLNPQVTEYKNMMDDLTAFMEDRGFSLAHRQRLRTYFSCTRDFFRGHTYDRLFERMSTKLRADTALIVGEASLRKVWWLQPDPDKPGFDFEPSFLGALAINLKTDVYETNEAIPSDKLSIIQRGLVARKIRLLGVGSVCAFTLGCLGKADSARRALFGQVIGTDCIIEDRHSGLREFEPANCLSFVQASSITRAEIFSIAHGFPRAEIFLQKATRHLTVRAALVIYYKKYKKENKPLPGRGGGNEAGLTSGLSLSHVVEQKLTNQDLSRHGDHKAQSAVRYDLYGGGGGGGGGGAGRGGGGGGGEIDARRFAHLSERIDQLMAMVGQLASSSPTRGGGSRFGSPVGGAGSGPSSGPHSGPSTGSPGPGWKVGPPPAGWKPRFRPRTQTLQREKTNVTLPSDPIAALHERSDGHVKLGAVGGEAEREVAMEAQGSFSKSSPGKRTTSRAERWAGGAARQDIGRPSRATGRRVSDAMSPDEDADDARRARPARQHTAPARATGRRVSECLSGSDMEA